MFYVLYARARASQSCVHKFRNNENQRPEKQQKPEFLKTRNIREKRRLLCSARWRLLADLQKQPTGDRAGQLRIMTPLVTFCPLNPSETKLDAS